MTEIAKAAGTAERLVMAGVEIARDQGLPALTARALADRAGTSPSALNYHLGGREALIERVLHEAREAAANWRAQQLAAIRDEGGGAPAWISPASILAAAIGDRVTTFRTWSLLLAEFEFEADAGNIPALAQAIGDGGVFVAPRKVFGALFHAVLRHRRQAEAEVLFQFDAVGQE